MIDRNKMSSEFKLNYERSRLENQIHTAQNDKRHNLSQCTLHQTELISLKSFFADEFLKKSLKDN